MGNLTTDQLRAFIANLFRDRHGTPNNKDGVNVQDVLNMDNGLYVGLFNGQYFSIKVEHLYMPEFAVLKAQSLGHRFTHGWAKNGSFWHMTCDACARQVHIRSQQLSGYALDERCDEGIEPVAQPLS